MNNENSSTTSNDGVLQITQASSKEIFRISQDGSGDYRIKFNKGEITLALENETEDSIEIVVKKK